MQHVESKETDALNSLYSGDLSSTLDSTWTSVNQDDSEKNGESSKAAANANAKEVWIHLKVSWAGQSFDLDVAETDRVYDIKALLQSLTDVPPVRQKILGLVKGKLPPDEETVASLKLTNGRKFTLVGTAEGAEWKDAPSMEETDMLKDIDIDVAALAWIYQKDPRTRRKITEATRRLKLNFMHPLREGKKLVVLDLDYTIVDTKPLLSGALPPIECARPRLHQFLEAIYPHYDICIWSQTSWVWLETKLIELQMIGSNRNYKISFVLDKTTMFRVFRKKDENVVSHHVKPLQIIWNRLPQYNATNTIHVDDLNHNFALNPRSGIIVSQFKNAHTAAAAADLELDLLAQYMVGIAQADDISKISHKHWKRNLSHPNRH